MIGVENLFENVHLIFVWNYVNKNWFLYPMIKDLKQAPSVSRSVNKKKNFFNPVFHLIFMKIFVSY